MHLQSSWSPSSSPSWQESSSSPLVIFKECGDRVMTRLWSASTAGGANKNHLRHYHRHLRHCHNHRHHHHPHLSAHQRSQYFKIPFFRIDAGISGKCDSVGISEGLFLLELIPGSARLVPEHYRSLNGLTLVFVFPSSFYLPPPIIIIHKIIENKANTFDLFQILKDPEKTKTTLETPERQDSPHFIGDHSSWNPF